MMEESFELPKEIKKTRKDSLEEIKKDISDLKGIVSNLVELSLRHEKSLEQKNNGTTFSVPINTPNTAPSVVSASPEITLTQIVPIKWRTKVDELLGKEFGLTVIDAAGGDFLVHIRVPDEWDCRIGDEKWLHKEDIRVGLVRRVSPDSDLEKWCKLIRANIQKIHPNFKV